MDKAREDSSLDAVWCSSLMSLEDWFQDILRFEPGSNQCKFLIQRICVCVCVPQVEWTSSREGGSNLISAKLPNKLSPKCLPLMMSTPEAAAWRSLRKKNMGFIMDSWDGSKWLMVSPKKQLVDCWNMLKPRSLSKILVNKTQAS